MSDNKKPEQRPPESYTPASPVKRTLAWIALAYVLIGLALTPSTFSTDICWATWAPC